MIQAESDEADDLSSPLTLVLFSTSIIVILTDSHVVQMMWKRAKSHRVMFVVAKHVYSLIVFTFLPAHLVFVCAQAYTCPCLCTSMPGIVFMSVYLRESTDTESLEFILLGMKLGSCYNTLAVVLLFWSALWSFPLQRQLAQ